MGNWHCYLGPILCASLHAVTGSGQLLCRDQAGSMERKGGLFTIWSSKTFGGLVFGHKLLCHHMTGTWPNTMFPFLTVLLRHCGGSGVGMSYICIFGLLKFILNGAGRIIFIEHKSDQASPLLSHCA